MSGLGSVRLALGRGRRGRLSELGGEAPLAALPCSLAPASRRPLCSRRRFRSVRVLLLALLARASAPSTEWEVRPGVVRGRRRRPSLPGGRVVRRRGCTAASRRSLSGLRPRWRGHEPPTGDPWWMMVMLLGRSLPGRGRLPAARGHGVITSSAMCAPLWCSHANCFALAPTLAQRHQRRWSSLPGLRGCAPSALSVDRSKTETDKAPRQAGRCPLGGRCLEAATPLAPAGGPQDAGDDRPAAVCPTCFQRRRATP